MKTQMISISTTVRSAHELQDATKGVSMHAPRLLTPEEILVVAGGPFIQNGEIS